MHPKSKDLYDVQIKIDLKFILLWEKLEIDLSFN